MTKEEAFTDAMEMAWSEAVSRWEQDGMHPSPFTAFKAGFLAGYESHIDQVAATFQKAMPNHKGIVEIKK